MNTSKMNEIEELANRHVRTVFYDARVAHRCTAGLERTVLDLLMKTSKQVYPHLKSEDGMTPELRKEDAESVVMLSFLARLTQLILKRVMYAYAADQLESDNLLKQCYDQESKEQISPDPTEKLYLTALYEINEAVTDINMRAFYQFARTLWCTCLDCETARSAIFTGPKSIRTILGHTVCTLEKEVFQELREAVKNLDGDSP